jgi:pimeloyl-ACP methyl ester carboxylesterase
MVKRWAKRCVLACLVTLAASRPEAAPMNDSEVIEAPGPAGPLSGTALQLSNSDAPIVLIVPGSGPTDRDGNSPLGIRASSYRLIAEGLAAHGIKSVRIDKRGMFGSVRAIPDANAVTMDEYAADVRTWVATIRQRMGVSCVWVLGHSEGGLVALLAAQRASDICGLLLVSTTGRRLGDVLRDQIRANPANAPIREQAEGLITRLEAGQRFGPEGIHPALLPLFRPEIQGFMISALALDPAKLIAAYQGPTLILQGLRDIQVGRTDAERLHQAHPDAEMVLLPNANHVLKAVSSDDRTANIATYQDPDRPLADGVIGALAAFVQRSRTDR